MKRNMQDAMRRLEIDAGIQNLVGELWKHCYKTIVSCDGHGNPLRRYIAFQKGTGDGWLEANARNIGLEKLPNQPCCEKHTGTNFCRHCGAGVNNIITYREKLMCCPAYKRKKFIKDFEHYLGERKRLIKEFEHYLMEITCSGYEKPKGKMNGVRLNKQAEKIRNNKDLGTLLSAV